MKIILSLFLFLFLLMACKDKDKMPPDILPQNKMREVMWDMVRAGEFLHAFVLQRDSSVDKAAESLKWYNKIYALHQTNKEQFEKSFTYYKEHPLLMKAIFDSLSRRQITDSHGPAAAPPDDFGVPKTDSIIRTDSIRNRFDTLIKKKILKRREKQLVS